jgi:tRNA(Arg) A34 adenosine deaminase TadA
MISPDDEAFMQLAIEASARALDLGDGPFGASLVKDRALIHVARNNQSSAGDLMGHAEVVLIREVVHLHGRSALQGATVYASGEPCAMCCGAMFWAGVARVVYAATQADIIAALGGARLPVSSRRVLAGAEPEVVIDGPLLRESALSVLLRTRYRQ